MVRNVKGTLFADYVRMIRRQKNVDWSRELTPSDLAYLAVRVEHERWYPMAVFEQLGNAILRRVAGGDMGAVRMFGRYSVDQLRAENPALVADGDPIETMNRFRVLRAGYFDFDALDVPVLHDDNAEVVIRYFMGSPAEEAAAHQTMGFFERLLELAGAHDVAAEFRERSWAGDARTLLSLTWKMAGPPPPRSTSSSRIRYVIKAG